MYMIEAKIKELFEKNNVAGMSVAITDRDRVVKNYKFGLMNTEEPALGMADDPLYRIASITKIISGLTVLRLVDRGVLELDRPVKEYLPSLTLSDKRAEGTVTLRHLLSHTAGLPKEYTPDGYRDESALETSLMEGLPTLELTSLPGEGKFLYSNWGIRLASLVAEKQTGKRFSELADELIIEPLGMNKTTFDIRRAITYPLSVPHEDDGEGGLRVLHYMKENAARHAAGGLYSSPSDLCILARFLLRGGVTDRGERIISEESMKEILAPHAKHTEEGVFYGLTMFLREHNGIETHGHIGSAPPYATSLWVDPVSGYGVVTLMNTYRPHLRYDIPDIIFEAVREKGGL